MMVYHNHHGYGKHGYHNLPCQPPDDEPSPIHTHYSTLVFGGVPPPGGKNCYPQQLDRNDEVMWYDFPQTRCSELERMCSGLNTGQNTEG